MEDQPTSDHFFVPHEDYLRNFLGYVNVELGDSTSPADIVAVLV